MVGAWALTLRYCYQAADAKAHRCWDGMLGASGTKLNLWGEAWAAMTTVYGQNAGCVYQGQYGRGCMTSHDAAARWRCLLGAFGPSVETRRLAPLLVPTSANACPAIGPSALPLYQHHYHHHLLIPTVAMLPLHLVRRHPELLSCHMLELCL